MDADWDGLAIGLLTADSLDVDDILKAINGCDLSLTALVGSPHNSDLIILANWYRSDLDGLYPVRRIYSICDSLSSCMQWCGVRFGDVEKSTYVVLLTEFLAQGGAHDGSSLAGGSAEVRLARLPSGAGNCYK